MNLKISLKIGIVFFVIVLMQLVMLLVNELEFTEIGESTQSMKVVLLPVYSGMLPGTQYLQDLRVRLLDVIITDLPSDIEKYAAEYPVFRAAFLQGFSDMAATLAKIKDNDNYGAAIRERASTDYRKVVLILETGKALIKDYDVAFAFALKDQNADADRALRAGTKNRAH